MAIRADFRPIAGFSLLEMMAAVTVAAILCAVGSASYRSSVEKARIAAASADIMIIATAISRYNSDYNIPPPDLATIGLDGRLDPWGHPYVYLSFTGLTGKGQMRKDKNLVPINSKYDLYSMGADGDSRPPLTAKVSRDDVVLANDGNYIGLASDY
jgi:general secretion pathway protein G